jgi:two-component system OmpR family sensor kinase
MSIIGFWINDINSKRVDDFAKEKYLKIVDDIFKNIENKNYVDHLITKYDLEEISSLNEKNLKTIYKQDLTFGNLSILKDNSRDEYIVYIKYLDDNIILKSINKEYLSDKIILDILIFLDIFALFVIFSYVIKLLLPLKRITKKIKNLASGDLSSRINIYSNDEIGTLATSFNTMATSLESLILAKEELLRVIGHELRTPIAKGIFITEKIQNHTDKELLKKIFYDLQKLIDDMIELEKLNIITLNITQFSAETLIINSLDKLYISDESLINLEITEDFKIKGDLHYLSIALKNLIDNALKYTISFPIYIILDKNSITVSNKATELEKDFNYYLKPFTQGPEQKGGFGLGLNIVKKIIDKHNLTLAHNYKDGLLSFNILF